MNALIAEYRSHLADSRRQSGATVRAYTATAQRLLLFLQGHFGETADRGILAKVTAGDLRAFLADRRGDGLTNRSTARELSAVRNFLRFALGDDAAIPAIKGPRTQRSLPRPIAPDDVLAMADDIAETARESWIGARDWAVLLLLYGSGLRISEATGLSGDILPLSDTLRVTGKRGKTRIVPLLPQVRDAIEAYLAACPHPTAKDQSLFRGARGGPLSPALIRRAVQGARRRMGLHDSATPHALRHSFATHLLAGGADLRSLQELLGHASLSSTQVYTGVDTAMLLDEYLNAHPRA
ncbi:tyrosine recombinase XerC [Sphingorhabdus arenilitoris]|uniref:Tyrosine recombinase XerC n=1 Tax=Sphingorhabdus arenilitoris TaxID=1490041 RepID=A0ABV8RHG4_9SPHN